MSSSRGSARVTKTTQTKYLAPIPRSSSGRSSRSRTSRYYPQLQSPRQSPYDTPYNQGYNNGGYPDQQAYAHQQQQYADEHDYPPPGGREGGEGGCCGRCIIS